jgi:NADPH:quinone reductase-like Zn-dependent oxidoreductase
VTTRAALTCAAVPLALLVAYGGSADGTTASGLIMSVAPSLCIGAAEASGVCVPGEDAEGFAVGDCVTFTYDGTPGDAANIRNLEAADAADHPDDCPPQPSAITPPPGSATG